MKSLITLMILALAAGCVQESKSTRSTSSSGNNDPQFTNSSSTTPSNDFSTGTPTEDTGLIEPTGDTTDPVDTTDPEIEDQICGQLYKSSSGKHYIINEVDGSEKYIIPNGYSAESILDGVTFPNDSYTACVWGKNQGASNYWYILNHIHAKNIQLTVKSVHPQRQDLFGDHEYSYCGKIYNQTLTSGKTFKLIYISETGMVYILDDETGLLSGAINAGGGETHGCVFGDDSPVREETTTFLRTFNVKFVSVGWQ